MTLSILCSAFSSGRSACPTQPRLRPAAQLRRYGAANRGSMDIVPRLSAESGSGRRVSRP